MATLQYDDGLIDYLNVLDAQRELFSAQLEYYAALGDTYITVVEIFKALGGGWVLDAEIMTDGSVAPLPCP